MSFRTLLTTAAVVTGVAMAATPALAGNGNGGATTCRKNCSSTGDATAPTVAIGSPSNGTTTSAAFTISGTAADNAQVSRVDVQVDGGAWQAASGTTSWSRSVSGLAAGSHTLTAKATDSSSNTSTATVTVTVSSSSTTTSGSDIVLKDPRAANAIAPLGRGRAATSGTRTTLLYWEEYTTRRAIAVRDSGSGDTTYLDLTVDSTDGWSNAAYALQGSNDLWVLGGGTSVRLRHYALDGTGSVPTGTRLLSSRVLGDSDSRPDDVLPLTGGGVAVFWHQQGSAGPQGIGIGYVSAAGSWSTLPTLQYMPTRASKAVAVQHPADGSVWLFTDPDAFGQIGAAHFTDTGTTLRIDWTDSGFITTSAYGLNGPDPENPDLAVAVDPAAGQLVLAYQSADRKTFSTNPVVTGSYVALARIGTRTPVSFTSLPVYVERVSSLSLAVRGADTWLGYRPIDQSTLTFDRFYTARLTNGAWQKPVLLGQLSSPYARVSYTDVTPQVSAQLADGTMHLQILG